MLCWAPCPAQPRIWKKGLVSMAFATIYRGIHDRATDELNQSEPTSVHPIPLTPQYYLAEIATPDELLVQVTQNDFQNALRDLVPSISQSELNHYLKIRKQFSSSVAFDTSEDVALG